MIGLLDEAEHLPTDVKTARQILQHLSNAGNTAASCRLKVISDFCAHIWSPADQNDPKAGSNGDQNAFRASVSSGHAGMHAVNDRSAVNQCVNDHGDDFATVDGSETFTAEGTVSEERPSHAPNDESSRHTAAEFTGGDLQTLDFNDITNSGLAYDFTSNVDGVYTSFYDPDLPLTGIDYSDWLEMERLFETPHN